MKCRACWSDKAYLREEKSLKATIYSCLGIVPFKCHHCYHKFWVPWFMTWGKTLHPPIIKAPSTETMPRHVAATPQRRAA